MTTLHDGSIVYDSYEEILEKCPIGKEEVIIENGYKITKTCYFWGYNGYIWKPFWNERKEYIGSN